MAVCYYNPTPTRVWGRVENSCTFNNDITAEYVYIPILNKIVPIGQVPYEFAILNKGNVLQYKKNSSNITKQQKYSQISKGLWNNRNKSYASQSQTMSIPNTKSLKQVNYTTITLNGAPIDSPVTCTKPIVFPTFPTLPANTGPQHVLPPMPPPPKPPSQNAVESNPVLNVFPPPSAPVVIPDGGNLICSITENICTGEILKSTSVNYCAPTSDSDVPGPIIKLCYNDGFLPTYYPRQNLTQASSGGNSFPQGYKGFARAIYFKKQ
jgi:hypothetical protein